LPHKKNTHEKKLQADYRLVPGIILSERLFATIKGFLFGGVWFRMFDRAGIKEMQLKKEAALNYGS